MPAKTTAHPALQPVLTGDSHQSLARPAPCFFSRNIPQAWDHPLGENPTTPLSTDETVPSCQGPGQGGCHRFCLRLLVFAGCEVVSR